MKRLLFFTAAYLVSLGAAWAQDGVAVRVISPPCGQFYVDGRLYTAAAMFLWPLNTWHTLAAGPSYDVAPGTTCTTGSAWTVAMADGSSALALSTGPTQRILVTGPATYSIQSSYYYLVSLTLNYGTGVPAFKCPGSINVTINGTCYDSDASVWIPGDSLMSVVLVPPSGWSFKGWSSGDFKNPSPSLSLVVNNPIHLTATWQAVGNFTINTNPPGMRVLVDQTITTTPASFQWAPGSAHALSPVSQQTNTGSRWEFLSWSDGGPENRIVTAPNAPNSTSLTLNYASGVTVSFGTVPVGLSLSIDGRTNWPSYNFVWAAGSTHTIAAPLDQSDANGVKYAFNQWTIGGPAAQTFTVAQSGSQRANAVYITLGQLVVQSAEANAEIMVNGSPCSMPCTINGKPGTQVTISAAPVIVIDSNTELLFQGWSDGVTTPSRVWTASAAGLVLSAKYGVSYRLWAVSNPAGGSNFQFTPATPDGFYPDGTTVTVTAVPKPGYTFEDWEGYVASKPTVQAKISGGPLQLAVDLTTYPYVAAIQNAAAVTPGQAVAPGSIISISGTNLAPDSETGPQSPLAQTLGNVMVQVNDQYLPLFSISPQQITAQLSSNFAAGQYALTVHQPGEADVSANFTVKRNAPGLFTNTIGDQVFASATHADGTSVTPDSPAVQGETITLLGTGFGPCQPAPLDGFAVPLLPANILYSLVDPVQIRVTDTAGDIIVLQPVSVEAEKGSVGMIAVSMQITSALPSATNVQLQAAVQDPGDPTGKTFDLSNIVLLPLK